MINEPKMHLELKFKFKFKPIIGEDLVAAPASQAFVSEYFRPVVG